MSLIKCLRKRPKGRKGFTLVEVLIVLVVLAVIAGAAIPIIAGQTSKGYRKEAIDNLSACREAMISYYQTHNNTYLGATFANIGYDPTTVGGSGQTRHFNYAIGGLAAGTFTVTATGGVVTVPANPLVAADTVVIDQTGTVTGTGVFA